MPNVEIKNETSFPLNIALSQVCPLHFGNSIAPASSLKIFCGSVWFTFEWGRDLETEKSRYSAGKSAKALALVSLATVGCMAVAGPLAVSAAAAAGSAGAAALLASPALVAAGSVEVLAVSGFVATVSSKQAFKRVASDNGVSKEGIDGTMSKVAIAEAAMAATSVIGLAKYFAKKTAATKVTQVVTAGASRLIWGPPKDPADEPKPIVEEGPDFEHGQTQRVFGVYIGFAPMHFAIREKLNEEGVLIAELWDEDKSTQVV